MKTIKYSLALLTLAALGLSSCQDDYTVPGLEDPKATMVPNTKLAEIKSIIAQGYDQENDVVLPVGTKADGSHYIIHGRVISSDASGNIYQNLVIQDETAALTLSIRKDNMWSLYRVGQDVVLDATGLYMGTYSGLYQLGWLDQYNGGPSMTFMSWAMFLSHNQKNGLPNQQFQTLPISGTWPSENPYCLVTTMAELSAISAATEQGRNLMSQLVEIQNVSFVEGGKETYAEYQENNERRYIQDAYGNTLALNNSGYSTFRDEVLPVGTGTVRGILGYYQDSWQITVRGLEDVMFDGKGVKDDPYTVEEAIEQDNNGRNVWTQGYIVGALRAGVTTVTSGGDILFGPDAETLNNVVIADNPNELDYTKCMLVNLPAGSFFREKVNLVDNPDMLGKLLFVKGTYAEYMGMHGIVDNSGGFSEFDIEGVDFGGEYGLGIKDNPYTVTYVLNQFGDETNVWVEGYIVGYVSGTDFATGARFTADTEDAVYNGANVLISASPDGANITNSIPVSCDRTKVGLKLNPQNLGKKVKFQGNLGAFFSTFGMPTTTDFELE